MEARWRRRVQAKAEARRLSFELPLAIREAEDPNVYRVHPTHPAVEEQKTLPDLTGVHALVVDDEADARDLIQRVMQEQGATVSVASGGEEALRMMETLSPDVLISDIGMPGMDGYQLIRRIPRGRAERSATPGHCPYRVCARRRPEKGASCWLSITHSEASRHSRACDCCGRSRWPDVRCVLTARHPIRRWRSPGGARL